MKKIISLLLVFAFIFLICGCSNQNTESTIVEQEMTVYSIKTEKCKTTDSIAEIEKVIDALGDIYKLETISDQIGTWEYKIELTVDGSTVTYMIGGKTFMDSDGTKYKIKYADETIDKIEEIYFDINADETYYI